ncbi:hypothetical protein KAJ41_02965 [Candidatus Parcubacteria bacterium]|nr:hypothetical protein [Candidatus Parcubacteria bacterium]
MNISSKLFRNKFNDYFISLDIGSETVKALIVRLDKEKISVIGIGERCQQEEGIFFESKDSFRNIVSVCAGAIDDAVNTAQIRPRKIVMSLNGNFVKGDLVKINYKREISKERVDKREMKNIISQISLDLYAKVKEIVQNKIGFDFDMEITHLSITSIDIDGYQVIDPIGFKGDNIEFTIFTSFMDHAHCEFIKNISRKLGTEIMEIVAQPYMVMIARGIKDVSKTNIVLVDIGERTTTVSVVHRGFIKSIKTFDIGGKFLVGRSLDNKVPKTLSDKIEKVASSNFEVLLDGIELSLEDLKHINLFTFKILCYGGGSRLLQKNRDNVSRLMNKRSSSFSKMKIDFIDSDDILKIGDETNKIKNSQYINSLSSANFILNKKTEEDRYDKILNSAIIK